MIDEKNETLESDPDISKREKLIIIASYMDSAILSLKYG